jgi:hypothetical protein
VDERGNLSTSQGTGLTPGQVAYEAYVEALRLTFPLGWLGMPPHLRDAWEVAAQAAQAVLAVLARQEEEDPP